MHTQRLFWLIVLLSALVGQPGNAARMDAVSIPVQAVPGSRMPSGTLPGYLAVPDGKGPFPAIVLLHGCSGRGSSQVIWATRLNSWGYAALFPDSFAPRGAYGGVCEPDRQHLVTPQDRAGDVLSAALWLRTQPKIDGTRIGVLGNSHGGTTAAWVTQERYEALFPHLLKASVDYYGACRTPATKGSVPLLALAGEDDTWGFPARTCREFGAALRPDQVFELHIYPGVAHDFDNSQQGPASKLGHPLGYNHDAAEDSFVRVKAFLDRYVRLLAQ
jgi:dienelactone hydrolase